jgi:hypothetical protein
VGKRGPKPRKTYYCTECDAEITSRRASRSGLCIVCAARRQRENMEQLKAKSGPYYERWLEACRAALEAAAGGGKHEKPSNKP